MIKQYIGECSRRVSQQAGHQALGQIFESCIGGGEYGKGSVSCQHIGQSGCNNSSFQGVVVGTCYDNIRHGCSGYDDRIDHMNHTVVGFNIGGGHHGIVDVYAATVDGHFDAVAVDRGDHLSVGKIRGHGLTGNHMVKQDLGEFTFGISQQAGHQALGQIFERCIGGGEHGERTGS